MLADIALRHRDYAEPELYDPAGRYGDVRWTAVACLVVGTVLGWGLVTNTTAELLGWQGYLLGAVGLGGRDGRLGVRQPRRAGGAGRRVRRRARPRRGTGAGAGVA